MALRQLVCLSVLFLGFAVPGWAVQEDAGQDVFTISVAAPTKAKDVQGYVIEVAGYASSPGSTEVNQKLSEDRANNVTNILLQKANVPLTRILAPGAMGESRPGDNDQSAEGQAENRRVEVRVLQNKAIAGL